MKNIVAIVKNDTDKLYSEIKGYMEVEDIDSIRYCKGKMFGILRGCYLMTEADLITPKQLSEIDNYVYKKIKNMDEME